MSNLIPTQVWIEPPASNFSDPQPYSENCYLLIWYHLHPPVGWSQPREWPLNQLTQVYSDSRVISPFSCWFAVELDYTPSPPVTKTQLYLANSSRKKLKAEDDFPFPLSWPSMRLCRGQNNSSRSSDVDQTPLVAILNHVKPPFVVKFTNPPFFTGEIQRNLPGFSNFHRWSQVAAGIWLSATPSPVLPPWLEVKRLRRDIETLGETWLPNRLRNIEIIYKPINILWFSFWNNNLGVSKVNCESWETFSELSTNCQNRWPFPSTEVVHFICPLASLMQVWTGFVLKFKFVILLYIESILNPVGEQDGNDSSWSRW